MQLTDLINVVEKTAPLSLAASWDNSGMQVARVANEVTHLAVCLDPTPHVIDQALARGAQCIVSHHPLLLQAHLPAKVDAFHTVLRLLFAADAALYAAHTSLDCNPHGPVSWLAQALSLRQCQLLEPTCIMADGTEAGFGLVGNLDTPVSLKTLMQTLQQHISLDIATLSGPVPSQLRRIAYCTGSGSSLAADAAHAGADIFITGDVKHHAAIDTTVAILDVGHHSLEEEMMRRFSATLQEQLPDIVVSFVASACPLCPAEKYLV